MNPDFWHQRWQEGRIGFHQSTPTPLLQKHWPSLQLPKDSQVFVPLAGKSLDMAWLAAQGHRVLGVELTQLAVEQFFAEHRLQPEIERTRYGTHYRAGGIELICGDAFKLDASLLAGCAAVFDRAAIIALPPDLRQHYVSTTYAQLPSQCKGLMITLEYPQEDRDGPPFSVQEAEVRNLFEQNWNVQLLERRPIPSDHPGYVNGASKLDTAVYTLHKI